MRMVKISKKQDSGSIAHILSSSGLSRGSIRWIPATSARMTYCLEQGSIMLEVVAVLALMGVMGAMLFRQIYQRNQELHNIQMASEIRTVKEAFSAYIQSNRASILSDCTAPTGGNVTKCKITTSINSCPSGVDYIACNVQDYLPDGWFTASELDAAYTFTLWNYLQNDGTGRRVVYGIIVPKEGTLPTTGWNFKRAARIALLIGADGGAYDETITSDNIAGALGSWLIPKDGIALPQKDGENLPTYAATTGIDLFTPEYEMPEGDMKIPENWSLALKNLHAYNGFSVGNKGTGNCYAIQHTNYATSSVGDNIDGKVQNDTTPSSLSANCQPLFWVGSKTGGAAPNAGNVYVATDLNIGDISGDSHNEALKLTAEGVIKQKDGLTIDKDGRIIAKETIATAVGELPANEPYVLDPAHISTMGDIRLTSRGGVKLSEILPNYILKETYNASCTLTNGKGTSDLSAKAGSDKSWCDVSAIPVSGGTSVTDIPVPSCPTGYSVAVVVSPSVLGKASIYSDSTINTGDTDSHHHSVPEIKSCSLFVRVHEDSSKGFGFKMIDGSTFRVIIGYRKQDEGSDNPTFCPNNTDTESLHAIVQTYCVYNGSTITVEDKYPDSTSCTGAGLTWVDAHCSEGGYLTTSSCTSAGKDWITGYCKNVYDLGNIDSISDLTKKAAACKAAGWTWDGTNCSSS